MISRVCHFISISISSRSNNNNNSRVGSSSGKTSVIPQKLSKSGKVAAVSFDDFFPLVFLQLTQRSRPRIYGWPTEVSLCADSRRYGIHDDGIRFVFLT